MNENAKSWLEPLEQILSYDDAQAPELDQSVVASNPKEHLQQIVLKLNTSIVKVIDSSLSQRKERLLLSATILEEIQAAMVEQSKNSGSTSPLSASSRSNSVTSSLSSASSSKK